MNEHRTHMREMSRMSTATSQRLTFCFLAVNDVSRQRESAAEGRRGYGLSQRSRESV